MGNPNLKGEFKVYTDNHPVIDMPTWKEEIGPAIVYIPSTGRKRLSWDKYFIGIAHAVAKRSEDPKYKVGAVIVSEDNRIVSAGYNGFKPGEIVLPKEWLERDKLRPRIIHAETNALNYAKLALERCRIYTTISPCMDCAERIWNANIREIVYDEPYIKYHNEVAHYCENHGILFRRPQ